ncbi:hypothetical protein V500_01914, partial [Pseudogymnoascus sp. VKM F-4518 (FW-2643)]
MMNLIYSIIAFTCLAAGSAVKPLCRNSSTATIASVTTTAINSSSITFLIAAPTSSAMANYSISTDSTAVDYPIGIRKDALIWARSDAIESGLTSYRRFNFYFLGGGENLGAVVSSQEYCTKNGEGSVVSAPMMTFPSGPFNSNESPPAPPP